MKIHIGPTSAVAFAVEPESRMIRGLLLPFGEVSRPARDRSTGAIGRYRFAAGTVTIPADPSDVVLNFDHEGDAIEWQVGVATELTVTPAGVMAAFKITKTPEGDRMLALADPETRVLKAFSAEVEGTFADPDADGVKNAIATVISGAAIARKPAFVGAHITSVAASAATDQEEPAMKCTKCGAVHAPGVTECQAAPDTAPAFTAADGKALGEQVAQLAKSVADLGQIQINPVGGVQVKEKPIYRFDGNLADSGFDFSTDFVAAIRDGDAAAGKRVMDFANASIMNPAAAVDFAIGQADTAAVNPAQYRPDMFKDEEPPLPSPLYDTFYAGVVKDNTPFFYSKLGTYSLGTAPHVEGVDPAEGSLNTVEGATITPVLRSGRFGLRREVIDQGGNPQVSGMIWNKVLRTHRLELEAIAASALKSKVVDYGTLATPAVGADGAAIGKALKGGLVDLRFTADGQRFKKFFAAKDLYSALSDAEEMLAVLDSSDEVIRIGNGRPLYPILAPSNADGTTASGLSSINVAGIKVDPTWSTSPQHNSFYVDPQAVKVWNSGLSRLDRVKESAVGHYVDFWFYAAEHVYDTSGVLKVAYQKA